IPPALKAELMKVLTAFGKSPEVAASLCAVPGAHSDFTNRQTHRTEAGGWNREPSAGLIGTLVESYFPANLGAGLRAPGFEPYLQFLRDTVFLRFRTRAYRRAAEKWEVAEAVLDVFYKLLRDYEPQPDDFVEQYVEMQGEEKAAYKPPGFSLMHHLLNESPMLELCLSLLEEGVVQLDTYAPFPGKKHLEKAVTCCFMLLNLTLQKGEPLHGPSAEEPPLADRHPPGAVTAGHQPAIQEGRSRGQHRQVFVPRLRESRIGFRKREDLVQHLQQRQRPSQNRGRFYPGPGRPYSSPIKLVRNLWPVFVECLDSEDSEEMVNPLEDIQEERRLAAVHHETKIHILNLLITSLEMKPPNLALYLLGFELKKPVSTTNLQDSGVLGFPRTCLHSILDVLKKGTDGRTGRWLWWSPPHLAELCYQVIHQLCACADTSGPTMRYLRTSQDFLVTQLHHLPFSVKGHEISILNQMSWLMKTASIELRITSLNRQRSHTQRLLNLLLDDVPVRPYIADGEAGMEDDSRSINAFLHFDMSSKVRRKVLSILDAIEFAQEIPEQLQLDFFDRVQIEQLITTCEHKNRSIETVCNVKLLRRVLVAEVNALQGMAAIGQRPLLLEEINTILQHAVERNKMFQCLHAKRLALESWRQLVEIILTACPQDLIPVEQRQLIIRDLLQDLHDKILDDEATKDLMPVVAGAVFTLTVHLSQCIRTEQKQPLSARAGGQSQYVLLLDGSFAAPTGTDTMSAGFASIGDSSLHMILRKLLEFILKTGGGLQRVRTHLYGALLYYLQIAQRPDEPDTLEAANKTMWERLTAPEDVFSKLQRDNLSIFETYGAAALMEVICRDSCDGREIGRMLALALLDRIVCIDKQQQWLAYLCNSGYLQALVDSLAEDDAVLQNLLNPQPPLLKALYIYESKMAFLTRVAKSQQGALELLRAGVILRLAQCQVYDMRPDTDQHGLYGMRDTSVFIPAPLERYRQILLPALQLCQVILTSSTAQHLQVAGQVLQFLIAHSDTIHAILRSKEGSLGSLQEMALLTGIISKAALPEVVNDLASVLNEGPMVELHGHLGRFQRLCLSLLNRFGGSDKARQLSLQDEGPHVDGVSAKDDMELAMQQICSNVMEYCHTLMLQNSPNLQQMVCLFTPTLTEGSSSGGSREASRLETQPSLFPSWRLPSLGIVFSLLKQCSSDFFVYYDIHRQSVSKLQNVEQLPPDEIKELCQSETPVGVDKISTTQKYLLARRRLVKLINSRAKLLSVCCYIIETCLFVLWRHLEYYLLQCTPSDSQDSLFSSTSFTTRRFQDTLNSDRNTDLRTLNRLSQQDMEMLQREGANLFGESLQKRLLEIESMYCKVRSRHSFIQALQRRIRGLLRVSRA
ncbi:unnamed protein product, partial [Ranitomeya imitator]